VRRLGSTRLGLLLVLSWATAAGAGSITVKGSDTMVGLCQRWAQAFRAQHPGVRLQITGGGSGTGLAALVEGATDVAMVSRPVAPSELEALRRRTGVAPVVVEVALDGVTFFVHPSNPLRALTPAQLGAAFGGRVARWSELGGPEARIILYTREATSGTFEFVRDHLLDGDDFSPMAQPLPGTGAVVSAVSRERHGVGFGGAAFTKGVVPLRIRLGDDEVSPTPETIRSGRYPFSRALTFVLAGPARGETKLFLDWVLSGQGQAHVGAAGFFPLR
jgi:phosphate transport system substrate-binding protein